MTRESCLYERQMTKAAATNQWNEELRAHLATCDVCQEAFRVASWMRGLAEADADDRRATPSAGFILWKSQLLKRRAAAERAIRPITIIQIFSGIIVALVTGVSLVWRPLVIEQGLNSFYSRCQEVLFPINEFYVLLMLVSLCVPLFCLAIVYVVSTIRKDGF